MYGKARTATSETGTCRAQVSTTQKGEGWKTPLGALMFALEKGIYSACVLFIGSAVSKAGGAAPTTAKGGEARIFAARS